MIYFGAIAADIGLYAQPQHVSRFIYLSTRSLLGFCQGNKFMVIIIS
ncbi:hypothetical protein [Dendronalium sp. ChiSLP03b]